MRTDDFAYDLPPELIAQTAMEPRDASRLLVLSALQTIEHRRFTDIVDYLRPGDALVLNDTRVVAARLNGRFEPGGGAVEALLTHQRQDGTWEALVRPRKRFRAGRTIVFGDAPARVAGTLEDGFVSLDFGGADPLSSGELPLPHYISQRPADPERYQTVYARVPGSAAAPTAGLHFTEALLNEIRCRGVLTEFITLHVGPGTFRPVSVDHPAQHPMHAEWFRLDQDVATRLNAVRGAGGRLFAVGTTVVRTIEQVAGQHPAAELSAASGWTRLLILPGYRFRAVDGLITNFHLPRSTLLMLVSALAGQQAVRHAYAEAVKHRYRFYSFGDAMLLLPGERVSC